MSTVCFCLVVLAIISMKLVNPLENGLARTPPMGWMSWGYYMCAVDCTNNSDKCLNETLIMSVADSFFTEGYQEAGYEYIIIDDCWSEKERVDGNLVADKIRFPQGMKFLADYIHARGLKFGIYTSVAKVTCMHYPASMHHMLQDVSMFAEWGVDYIKVDGCYTTENVLNNAYIQLGNYLNGTGRPIVYSCSWPFYIEFIHNKMPNYPTIEKHCNLWRNYLDVHTNWPSIADIIRHYEQQYHKLSQHHGPGHWNDPDMLILGTDSLTIGQSRVHMAFHSMMSAPLLLSCDMSKLKPFEKEMLTNLDLIAVAQDPLGIMAQPYKLIFNSDMQNSLTMWVKRHLPMKGDYYHSFSFALINMGTRDVSVSFTPGHYGLNSTDGYSVMSVLSHCWAKATPKLFHASLLNALLGQMLLSV